MTDDDERREWNCAPALDYSGMRTEVVTTHKHTVVRRVGRKFARGVWQSVCVFGWMVSTSYGAVTPPPEIMRRKP